MRCHAMEWYAMRHNATQWNADEWLFHFPAQTVVTCTQIYWTEESEASLEDLSGGQEDAVKRCAVASFTLYIFLAQPLCIHRDE